MLIKSGSRKKVVLIESQSPGHHVFSMVLLPRIGIILLGTILRNMGYDVTIIVENFHGIDWKKIQEADIVCISLITCTSIGGYKIAKRCREMGKTVIIGGSHPTFMAEEAAQYADYVCIGEAEWSFPELVNAILRNDSNPKDVNGIAYKMDELLIKTKPSRPVTSQDLNNFPFPDFSLIYGNPKMKITPIVSSRGCPHSCDFCSVIVMFGRKMRYRNEDNVFEEIKDQKPRHIFFYDDNFTINKERTWNILTRIMSLPKNKRPTWSAQVDVGIASDKDLIRFMGKSGCEYVYVGFESINQKTLEAYNKKQDIGKIKRCIEAFHKNGINIHGMFVFDPKNDNSDIIDETCRFVEDTKIETVQFLNLTPLPGTPLWQREEKNLLTRDWSLFDAHHTVLEAQKMTTLNMQEETINAMKRFYSLSRVWSLYREGNKLAARFRMLGWYIVKKWERDEKGNNKYLEFLKLRSMFLDEFRIKK
ncbi:MAG: Radical SAM domain protein [Parcubacteria group bacterium GW2011_GWD2_38_12]|uniref:Uncharacterized protein n=1 Tax=Candidatus Azambacteria bacterium RIFCSPLOWO2_01_FULL_37_9 TaxID=1797297 RepID=A0A1F5C7K8_9BACT|nr:MAG: Radical SAM domain protein [Parcubacteria group bacterium GW2011_GWC2_36_17]KKQ38220.1 MAG: Radical SAM domain protein [Candidatus Moranbacteria bacterium GW2011_GWF2_37_7]KKQ43733.1 MAG: Radical SAM domain protein [Parcubacteria group bacterium GW2011_GWE2_37_8]KKQ52620.1 MAG: Radical SAM domain protein [Parcubacteria group bacterium GW2011_GWD2_38_12]KKQ58860.1 MAG: Radical SAM domain protein [Parcubacteria group bacterium GW2011_GWC1_38_17]OGD38821.1 MAG: hypothetical protein A2907_